MPLRNGIASWIFTKEPELNDYADAVKTVDSEGRVKYVLNGQDVTREVKKYGAGIVKKATVGQRIWAPDTAANISALNTEYKTTPGRHRQQIGIQSEQARKIARTALASTRGVPESSISDDEIAGVVAQSGYGIGTGGLSAQALNEMRKATTAGLAGEPEMTGRLAATLAKSAAEEEEAFRRSGGPATAGRARGSQARYSGTAAERETRLSPLEEAQRRVDTKLGITRARRALGRSETVERGLDVGAENVLREATQITPQEQRLARRKLRTAIAQQPGQARLSRLETELATEEAERVRKPQLTVAGELAKQAAENIDLQKAAAAGEMRGRAAAATMPPAALTESPYVYRYDPVAGKYVRVGKNPAFVSEMEKKVAAMGNIEKAMSGVTGGAGGLITLPNGSTIKLDSGAGAAPSTAAPQAVNRKPVASGALTGAMGVVAPIVQKIVEGASNRGMQLGSTLSASDSATGVVRQPTVTPGSWPVMQGRVGVPSMQDAALSTGTLSRLQELKNKATTYMANEAELAELKRLQELANAYQSDMSAVTKQ